jgi:hypothetical protein
MSTSHRTIKWIENLADQERLIKAGERVSIDICTTKDEVLTVETTTFVRDLFYHLEYLSRLFNSRVHELSLEIKISRSENLEGFALSRNRMRLTLGKAQLGVVKLTCEKIFDGDGLSKGNRASVMFSGLIEAKFGTFHDVEWYFLGSRVSAEQVARHYLTEFIQSSRTESQEN